MHILHMTWMSERLAQLRKGHKDLAAAIGKDRSVATKIVNGEQQVRLDQIGAVAKVLEVSPKTLLIQLGIPIDTIDTPIQHVPVFDTVQASHFGMINFDGGEPAYGYMDVVYPFDTVFGLRVEGDSMDRVAPEGSTVICDSRFTALHDGLLYVIRLGDEATFKRYRQDETSGWLEPDSSNPRHQRIFPTEDIVFVPLGRVVDIKLPTDE